MVEPVAIVVGAGTAGMACAIAIADAGRRVLVLEKSDRPGGTLHVSYGHMSAAGTRRQASRGIADATRDHFDDVMRISEHAADPALVRLAVVEAPRTVDWLDELGFSFDPESPKIYPGHEPYSQPRTYWGTRLGRSILEVLCRAWDEHVCAGRIDLRTDEQLVDLIVEDGVVRGVLTIGGSEHRAPATVLCTGGYGAEPELFADLTPGRPRLVTAAMSTSTGDGLRAARRAGAAIRGGEHHVPRLGAIEWPTAGRFSMDDAFANLSAIDRPPREIWVNAEGRRFVAEDDTSVTVHERAASQQTDSAFWIVFDDAAIDDGACLVRQWDGGRLRRLAREERIAWRADEVESLGSKAGLPPAVLVETVARYNAGVDRGEDVLGRGVLDRRLEAPPFYAVRIPTAVMITFGGIAVDDQLRALTAAGEPIPGLYAAGEAIGAAATSGRAFCGGMLVTPALSFGRVVGHALAGADGCEK